MAINQRAKGARGERLLRDFLRSYGFQADRDGQQGAGGGKDHPDVRSNLGLHIESKFTERLNLDAACLQAATDAGSDQWVVCSKKKNKPWLATLPMHVLLDIIKDKNQSTKNTQELTYEI